MCLLVVCVWSCVCFVFGFALIEFLLACVSLFVVVSVIVLCWIECLCFVFGFVLGLLLDC